MWGEHHQVMNMNKLRKAQRMIRVWWMLYTFFFFSLQSSLSLMSARDAALHFTWLPHIHLSSLEPPAATSRNEIESNSPRSVRTKSNAVESATQFRFIFGMTLQIAQLMHAMSKLTFITIFAFASFLEWTTQLRLVAVCNWEEKKEINLI